MILLLGLAICLAGGFVAGWAVGIRRTDRKWLAAMLDDTADYDTMLASILQAIQDDAA